MGPGPTRSAEGSWCLYFQRSSWIRREWGTLNNGIEFDEKRGEVKLLGVRQMIMSMDALCNHLDTLVGDQVAEVIIKNLELQEGKEEAERFLRNHPDAKVEEFLDVMVRYDALSGVGITSVKLSENQDAPRFC